MEDFAEFHARFCARLRELRLQKGFMQVDLEDAGIGLGTLQHIEQGRHQPRLETLWRLARAFGIEPRELLDLRGVSASASRPTRGGSRQRGKPAGQKEPASARKRG